jgi:excisionase family DNA binding protein
LDQIDSEERLSSAKQESIARLAKCWDCSQSLPTPGDIDDPYVRLLTKREIARVISKSERSIDNMMKGRVIPFLKLGRSVRFKLRDVEKALSKLTVREVSI